MRNLKESLEVNKILEKKTTEEINKIDDFYEEERASVTSSVMLGIFFGFLGLNYFYIKQYVLGVLMCVLFVLSLVYKGIYSDILESLWFASIFICIYLTNRYNKKLYREIVKSM